MKYGTFYPKIRNRAKMFIFTISIHHCKAMRGKKKIKV